MTKQTKVHLGCGPNKLDGWLNLDSVREFNPDMIHDVRDALPLQDLTVDEILAEGLLEHFDKYMRYVVVGDWVRVLKVGGLIHLELPDFKKILFNRYFKFKFDDLMDTIFGENLWESKIYIGHFGNHKWGYSRKTLPEFVQQFGLKTLDLKEMGLNLRLRAEKLRHVTCRELDELKIYSHANKCGDGEPFVTLSAARERIKEFQEDQRI